MLHTESAAKVSNAEDISLAAHGAVVGAAELDDVAGGEGVGVTLVGGWGCDGQSGEGEDGDLELHVCVWYLRRGAFEVMMGLVVERILDVLSWVLMGVVICSS